MPNPASGILEISNRLCVLGQRHCLSGNLFLCKSLPIETENPKPPGEHLMADAATKERIGFIGFGGKLHSRFLLC